MKGYVLDTNVLIRFFIQDLPNVGRGVPVASFARDLDRFKDLRRYQPRE